MQFPQILTKDILDSVSEGVFTVNKDFKITFLNRAAERITGYTRDEVIGKLCKHVFKAGDCKEPCPIARVLESGDKIWDFGSTIISYPKSWILQSRSISSIWAKKVSSNNPALISTSFRARKAVPEAQNTRWRLLYWPLSCSIVLKRRPRSRGNP